MSRATIITILVCVCLSFAAICHAAEKSRLIANLESGKQQTLVTYGTSLTDGAPWVAELRSALERSYPGKAKVVNSGRGAMWSGWGVENLEQRVIDKKPDAVLIEFTINDAFLPYNTSVEQARKNIENMIGRILKANPNCDIILMVMNPPVGVHLEQRPKIKDYNQMFRDVARDRKLLLIDHYPNWEKILKDEPALFKKYVPDGIHPGAEGCKMVITPEIVRALGYTSKPADPLDVCNVVWDSPSKDSGGSMPLGNGDIGLNAWVEQSGDLVFFISKTDSWTDSGRLVKLGQVRVRLTPSLAVKPFRQELQIRKGVMVVQSASGDQKSEIRLWVDANRPVIHIEGESQQDMQAQVGLYVWRTGDRDMQKDGNIGYISELNTGPVMEKADTVLPQKDNRIVWYHRNEGTIVPLTMKLQGVESLLPLVHDPILHNTFGGAISGKGMVPAEAGTATQALKTAAPIRRLDIAIHLLGVQTDTAEQWLEKLDGIVAEEHKIGLENAWKAHCMWWQEFWNRSWIYVNTPEDDTPATAEQAAARVKERSELQLTGNGGLDNHTRPTISDEPAGQLVTRGYALQRFMLAASCRGAYPVKHDGSIFTVNNRNRNSLVDADYRVHGANYWFLDAATTMYGPMLRSGDYDLLMPLFKMYSAMVPMARERTKLQYHHEGLYVPATVYAWGTYQENEYVRWLWHGGLELMAKMLDYCEATGDEAYLRETVLPLADGVITFYDQHWKRDEKCKIRMDPACALESGHVVVNPLPEIAGLRYVLPRLLALPEKATTAAQRAAWKKTLADVPEMPMATLKDAAAPAQSAIWKLSPSERPEVRMSSEADKNILVAAEVIKTWQGDEVPDLYAVFPYRLYAFDSKEADIGRRTFERWNPVQPRSSYPWEGRVGGWRLSPIQAAFVGKAGQAARMVTSNFSAHDPGSRFPAFWGPVQVGINDQSHGGVSMTALQAMLLQVVGKKIYLFPAWPKQWDVHFKLHALYNTTVEGELRDGKVVLLKVTPESRAADVVNMLAK